MAGNIEDEVFEALSNKLRRDIIVLLHDRIELTHKELMDYLGVSSGLLNFHLRKLGGLVEKTERGTYKLSRKGLLAYEFIREIRGGGELEKTVGPPPPGLDPYMAAKRFAASAIDMLAIFLATGLLFDPQLWSLLYSLLAHIADIWSRHPWIFHPAHLAEIGELLFRFAAAYSHVFFAAYILLTLLEAYKGQTLGKYLLGLRVVKRTGRRLDLVESGIRNAGKIFLLPIDLALGLPLIRKGYLRYTDYYIDAVVVDIKRREAPSGRREPSPGGVASA